MSVLSHTLEQTAFRGPESAGSAADQTPNALGRGVDSLPLVRETVGLTLPPRARMMNAPDEAGCTRQAAGVTKNP